MSSDSPPVLPPRRLSTRKPYNPSRYSPSRGGHAPGHLRAWFLSSLDPAEYEIDADEAERRPSLTEMTGLLWNCTDCLSAGTGRELLSAWCHESRCPICLDSDPGTYGRLARIVRRHLESRAETDEEAVHAGEVTTEFKRRQTAIHEAGHAVAAHLLGRAVKSISMIGADDSLAHVEYYEHGRTWHDRIVAAEYASDHGQFIDSRTRRSVETEIMTAWAGGLTLALFEGLGEHEVGVGLEALESAEAAHLASGSQTLEVVGGDYETALDLARRVSDGDKQADAYLAWLKCRTESLMGDPFFKPLVNAVADALCNTDTLSASSVREIITKAEDSVRSRRTR